MNNLSMALKNLKKNFSFYALYLLSVSFVITVFFAFTSFSMNTVMLEKISGNGRVEMMCNVISVFLMAFVVFYMSYSNRFFLRRRTKELGVYALLGYRKTTVLSLLTTENLLVCFGAFIVGILLGIFFHKGIVFGITKLLDLSINNSKIPFFNVNAIAKTACFIFAIVIVLMLSNSRFLFKTSLMGLVRFENIGDEYYIYDDERKTLKGEKSNKVYKIGDKVKIMETRPLSKDKRWRVVEITEKATLV